VVALAATYDKEAIARYPSLGMEVRTRHGRWPSLLYGAIEAVLERFSEELLKRDAGGRYQNDPPNAHAILRVAGAFFTRIHAWAGKRFSPLDIQFRGTLEFIEACNRISALPYETRAGLGGILIADVGHEAVTVAVQLAKSVMADKHKRVRKLLEMCKDGMYLLSDSRYIWGIGTVDETKYDSKAYYIFTVSFVGHGHWELWYLHCHLMTVKDGNPRLPRPRVDVRYLRDALQNKFPG